MKILFITSNRVGDAVLSTGLLAALAARYPGAKFTIACGPYAAGLFHAVPGLERLIVLEKKSWNRHWLGLWRLCAGTRWDLIVDLRNSIVAHLLHAKKRAVRVKLPGQHKVIENAAVLDTLSRKAGEGARALDAADLSAVALAKADECQPPAPHIWLDEQAINEAAKILPAARPLLALAPAANWPCKQWPLERFAALAQKLTAEDGPLPGAHILVIADRHEREQLAPLLQDLTADRHVEITGRDLLTVAACLKDARLFVGNDSGLMHMAAAMGTPTLGLFGPGYEEIYGPWGPHSAFVRTPESREELLARLLDLSAKEPNLMGGLTVEAVFQAAEKLLARTAAQT